MAGGGITERWPSEDATVIWYEKRERGPFLRFVGVVLALLGGGLAWALTTTHATAWRWVEVGLFAPAIAFMLIGGTAGALMVRNRFVFDATGWWWLVDDKVAVVPWESLAGAGVYCSGGTAAKPQYATLELFPRGEFDRDDPVLWKLVRDEDPPLPGLSRLRYRLHLQRLVALLPDVEAAARQYAPPDLWFGRVWKERDYVPGHPDRRGHRRRLRERAAGLPAAPSDAVPSGAVQGGNGPEDTVPAGSDPTDREPADREPTDREPTDRPG
ncbi:hypothetical protein [Actinacidiphila yanglinensis]|nr:hypothetical protein [Actinacidiphila yanglinensis]